MKWYLIVDNIDWADEFNLPIGELLDESTYKKYQYMSETLGSYTGFYGFGTNEYYDDFEYLGWKFTEITEEEKVILDKLDLPNGYSFTDNLFDIIEDDMIDNDLIDKEDLEERRYGFTLKEKLEKMPFDKFALYIDRYAKFLKDRDED